ncbi:hypothetical protein RSAG8_01082, partial [Rhizoctonia solani AG-8 WAC10335]
MLCLRPPHIKMAHLTGGRLRPLLSVAEPNPFQRFDPPN